MYEFVYGAVRTKVDAMLKPLTDKHNAMAFDLLERMLPKELVELPAPVVVRVGEMERAA
jgi:hypothetical protein